MPRKRTHTPLRVLMNNRPVGISLLDRISTRHFQQTAKKVGVPEALVDEAIREIHERAEPALRAVENTLPAGFPEVIHAAVYRSLRERLGVNLLVTPNTNPSISRHRSGL